MWIQIVVTHSEEIEKKNVAKNTFLKSLWHKIFYAAISAQWIHSHAPFKASISEVKNSLNETIQINHIVPNSVS